MMDRRCRRFCPSHVRRREDVLIMAAQTPNSAVAHENKFKPQAWEAYSLLELGQWVHLLAKRSEHRADAEKKAKDLEDAQNYLDMMQAKLNALK